MPSQNEAAYDETAYGKMTLGDIRARIRFAVSLLNHEGFDEPKQFTSAYYEAWLHLRRRSLPSEIREDWEAIGEAMHRFQAFKDEGSWRASAELLDTDTRKELRGRWGRMLATIERVWAKEDAAGWPHGWR